MGARIRPGNDLTAADHIAALDRLPQAEALDYARTLIRDLVWTPCLGREPWPGVLLLPKEALLLHFLSRHVGRRVPPDRLITAIWGYDAPLNVLGSLRVHLCRVRQKIAAHGEIRNDGHGRVVFTVRAGVNAPWADRR